MAGSQASGEKGVLENEFDWVGTWPDTSSVYPNTGSRPTELNILKNIENWCVSTSSTEVQNK